MPWSTRGGEQRRRLGAVESGTEDDHGVRVAGSGDLAVEDGVDRECDELHEDHGDGQRGQGCDDEEQDLGGQQVLHRTVAQEVGAHPQTGDGRQHADPEDRRDDGRQVEALASDHHRAVDQQVDFGPDGGERAEDQRTGDEQCGRFTVRIVLQVTDQGGGPHEEQCGDDEQVVTGVPGFPDDLPDGPDRQKDRDGAEDPGGGHACQPVRCAAARPASRPARFAPTVEAVEP